MNIVLNVPKSSDNKREEVIPPDSKKRKIIRVMIRGNKKEKLKYIKRKMSI